MILWLPVISITCSLGTDFVDSFICEQWFARLTLTTNFVSQDLKFRGDGARKRNKPRRTLVALPKAVDTLLKQPSARTNHLIDCIKIIWSILYDHLYSAQPCIACVPGHILTAACLLVDYKSSAAMKGIFDKLITDPSLDLQSCPLTMDYKESKILWNIVIFQNDFIKLSGISGLRSL